MTGVIRRTFQKKYFLPSIARLVCFVFLFDNVAFAHKPQTTLWDERAKNYEVASLPAPLLGNSASLQLNRSLVNSLPAFGPIYKKKSDSPLLSNLPETFLANVNIRDAHIGKTGPTVVFIEDIHQNLEAQTHISEALKAFGDMPGAEKVLVGLEGASGRFLYDQYKQFPDQTIAKAAADSFFQRGEISGPAHAGFTSFDKPGARGLSFWGVDDPAWYENNVRAYLIAHPLKASLLTEIQKQNQAIAQEKRLAFSPELMAFDQAVESHRRGEMGLGEYVRRLNASSFPRRRESSSLTLDQFLAAYEMEKSLNLPRVEAERAVVLDQLVKTMGKDDLNGLVAMSLGYQQGSVSFGDYHDHLRTLCRKNSVDLRKTPAFDDYIRYVLLVDGVKADELFAEVNQREQEIYENLTQTEAQKNLVARSRQLYLISQLADFSLTSDQWGTYLKGRNLFSSEFDLAPFEKFYLAAEKRNGAMVKNLLRVVTLDPGFRRDDVAVLVAGGYHSLGLSRLLGEQGYSYVVASPKVTKVETASASQYLSVFDREKTPLEKIFSGQKLFVVQTPIGAANRPNIAGGGAIMISMVLTVLGQFVAFAKNIAPALRWAAGFLGKEFVSTLQITKETAATFLKFKTYDGAVLVTVPSEGNPVEITTFPSFQSRVWTFINRIRRDNGSYQSSTPQQKKVVTGQPRKRPYKMGTRRNKEKGATPLVVIGAIAALGGSLAALIVNNPVELNIGPINTDWSSLFGFGMVGMGVILIHPLFPLSNKDMAKLIATRIWKKLNIGPTDSYVPVFQLASAIQTFDRKSAESLYRVLASPPNTLRPEKESVLSRVNRLSLAALGMARLRKRPEAEVYVQKAIEGMEQLQDQRDFFGSFENLLMALSLLGRKKDFAKLEIFLTGIQRKASSFRVVAYAAHLRCLTYVNAAHLCATKDPAKAEHFLRMATSLLLETGPSAQDEKLMSEIIRVAVGLGQKRSGRLINLFLSNKQTFHPEEWLTLLRVLGEVSPVISETTRENILASIDHQPFSMDGIVQEFKLQVAGLSFMNPSDAYGKAGKILGELDGEIWKGNGSDHMIVLELAKACRHFQENERLKFLQQLNKHAAASFGEPTIRFLVRSAVLSGLMEVNWEVYWTDYLSMIYNFQFVLSRNWPWAEDVSYLNLVNSATRITRKEYRTDAFRLLRERAVDLEDSNKSMKCLLIIAGSLASFDQRGALNILDGVSENMRASDANAVAATFEKVMTANVKNAGWRRISSLIGKVPLAFALIALAHFIDPKQLFAGETGHEGGHSGISWPGAALFGATLVGVVLPHFSFGTIRNYFSWMKEFIAVGFKHPIQMDVHPDGPNIVAMNLMRGESSASALYRRGPTRFAFFIENAPVLDPMFEHLAFDLALEPVKGARHFHLPVPNRAFDTARDRDALFDLFFHGITENSKAGLSVPYLVDPINHAVAGTITASLPDFRCKAYKGGDVLYLELFHGPVLPENRIGTLQVQVDVEMGGWKLEFESEDKEGSHLFDQCLKQILWSLHKNHVGNFSSWNKSAVPPSSIARLTSNGLLMMGAAAMAVALALLLFTGATAWLSRVTLRQATLALSMALAGTFFYLPRIEFFTPEYFRGDWRSDFTRFLLRFKARMTGHTSNANPFTAIELFRLPSGRPVYLKSVAVAIPDTDNRDRPHQFAQLELSEEDPQHSSPFPKDSSVIYRRPEKPLRPLATVVIDEIPGTESSQANLHIIGEENMDANLVQEILAGVESFLHRQEGNQTPPVMAPNLTEHKLVISINTFHPPGLTVIPVPKDAIEIPRSILKRAIEQRLFSLITDKKREKEYEKLAALIHKIDDPSTAAFISYYVIGTGRSREIPVKFTRSKTKKNTIESLSFQNVTSYETGAHATIYAFGIQYKKTDSPASKPVASRVSSALPFIVLIAAGASLMGLIGIWAYLNPKGLLTFAGTFFPVAAIFSLHPDFMTHSAHLKDRLLSMLDGVSKLDEILGFVRTRVRINNPKTVFIVGADVDSVPSGHLKYAFEGVPELKSYTMPELERDESNGNADLIILFFDPSSRAAHPVEKNIPEVMMQGLRQAYRQLNPGGEIVLVDSGGVPLSDLLDREIRLSARKKGPRVDQHLGLAIGEAFGTTIGVPFFAQFFGFSHFVWKKGWTSFEKMQGPLRPSFYQRFLNRLVLSRGNTGLKLVAHKIFRWDVESGPRPTVGIYAFAFKKPPSGSSGNAAKIVSAGAFLIGLFGAWAYLNPKGLTTFVGIFFPVAAIFSLHPDFLERMKAVWRLIHKSTPDFSTKILVKDVIRSFGRSLLNLKADNGVAMGVRRVVPSQGHPGNPSHLVFRSMKKGGDVLNDEGVFNAAILTDLGEEIGTIAMSPEYAVYAHSQVNLKVDLKGPLKVPLVRLLMDELRSKQMLNFGNGEVRFTFETPKDLPRNETRLLRVLYEAIFPHEQGIARGFADYSIKDQAGVLHGVRFNYAKNIGPAFHFEVGTFSSHPLVKVWIHPLAGGESLEVIIKARFGDEKFIEDLAIFLITGILLPKNIIEFGDRSGGVISAATGAFLVPMALFAYEIPVPLPLLIVTAILAGVAFWAIWNVTKSKKSSGGGTLIDLNKILDWIRKPVMAAVTQAQIKKQKGEIEELSKYTMERATEELLVMMGPTSQKLIGERIAFDERSEPAVTNRTTSLLESALSSRLRMAAGRPTQLQKAEDFSFLISSQKAAEKAARARWGRRSVVEAVRSIEQGTEELDVLQIGQKGPDEFLNEILQARELMKKLESKQANQHALVLAYSDKLPQEYQDVVERLGQTSPNGVIHAIRVTDQLREQGTYEALLWALIGQSQERIPLIEDILKKKYLDAKFVTFQKTPEFMAETEGLRSLWSLFMGNGESYVQVSVDVMLKAAKQADLGA